MATLADFGERAGGTMVAGVVVWDAAYVWSLFLVLEK